ncbi:MAG: DUF234 domain-containing protein [Pseudonocardia sp.]
MHLGRVFEQAAREHAVRMVAATILPEAMKIGRWWRAEVAAVDVLGLLEDRTRLVGEARWQASPLSERDLRDLRGKAVHLPAPHPDLQLAFWSRGGADRVIAQEPGLLVFTPADMVEIR